MYVFENVGVSGGPLADGLQVLVCLVRGKGDRSIAKVPDEANVDGCVAEWLVFGEFPWYAECV